MISRTLRYILTLTFCIGITAGVYFVQAGEFSGDILKNFHEINIIGSVIAPNVFVASKPTEFVQDHDSENVTPDPKPKFEPEPNPMPTIEPESKAESTSEVMPEPKPKPKLKSDTKQAPAPIIKTIPKLEPEPTTAPEPEPVPESEPDPQPDPVHQPIAFELTQAEQQMLMLVNKERESIGVPPLKMDIELTKVARLKSQDMIDFNYFSHESPTYGSPFEMMKSFGIHYRFAAENIAGSSTVEKAHTNWMSSPGHKANILDPRYTHIGIGIKSGGKYGLMFTQMFIGK